MKANELRIGNYVWAVMPEKPIRVDWLVMKQMSECNGMYEPITLTDEILRLAGFTLSRPNLYITRYWVECESERMEIQYDIESRFFGVADTDFGGCNAYAAKPVQYLHQLQNLYFALAGEELNIEL